MKTASLFISLFFTLALYSQKEANNWVFGDNAGVSWNTGVPVAFTGAIISQVEGVACMSDAAGQLLFYTEGLTVRNRMHQLMPNGSGLLGGVSSSQSAITVPWPADPTKYFLFTAPDNASNGLAYSVIDMSLQGGLGDIVASSKNTVLYTQSCEKVTAVKHANGIDVWVVSHQLGSNAFYTYLVTSAGVNSTPVISNSGSVLSGGLGYMKTSPDGTKLANAVFDANYFEVFDFNNSTGIVSNNFLSDGPFTGAYYPYGVEFSPSGRYLYLSGDGMSTAVYQYDLLAANILLSRTTVGTMLSSGGALQLAPDNKVYVADYAQGYLHAINDPDQPGTLCNFQTNAVYLQGATVEIGLPNFISSYFTAHCTATSVSINATENTICAYDSSQICAPAGFTSYLWNTGATGQCITAKLAGNYYVTVTDNNGCTVESNHVALSVYPQPPVSISVNGDTLSVYNAVTQQWYRNGSPISNATLSSYIITQDGSYTVMITDSNGCTATSNPVVFSGISNVSEGDGVSVVQMAADRWQLTVGNSWLGSVAEIFDVNGRLVFKSEITNHTSEISPFSKGVYLLRISSNKSSVVRKLVKL